MPPVLAHLTSAESYISRIYNSVGIYIEYILGLELMTRKCLVLQRLRRSQGISGQARYLILAVRSLAVKNSEIFVSIGNIMPLSDDIIRQWRMHMREGVRFVHYL